MRTTRAAWTFLAALAAFPTVSAAVPLVRAPGTLLVPPDASPSQAPATDGLQARREGETDIPVVGVPTSPPAEAPGPQSAPGDVPAQGASDTGTTTAMDAPVPAEGSSVPQAARPDVPAPDALPGPGPAGSEPPRAEAGDVRTPDAPAAPERPDGEGAR